MRLWVENILVLKVSVAILCTKTSNYYQCGTNNFFEVFDAPQETFSPPVYEELSELLAKDSIIICYNAQSISI
jgi:hypothetical protein